MEKDQWQDQDALDLNNQLYSEIKGQHNFQFFGASTQDNALKGKRIYTQHCAAQKLLKGEDAYFAYPVGSPIDSKNQVLAAFGFYGVLDGHHGSVAVRHVVTNLYAQVCQRMPSEFPIEFESAEGQVCAQQIRLAVLQAFLHVDATLPDLMELSGMVFIVTPLGCTCTVAIIVGNLLTVGNVGDSRALFDNGQQFIPMTVDHRIQYNQQERVRLLRQGAKLAQVNHRGKGPCEPGTTGVGPIRIWPRGVTVSRSFGNVEIGEYIVVHPHIRQMLIPSGGGRVILASDGVWDSISSYTLCQVSRSSQIASAPTNIINKCLKTKRALIDDTTVLVLELSASPSQPAGQHKQYQASSSLSKPSAFFKRLLSRKTRKRAPVQNQADEVLPPLVYYANVDTLQMRDSPTDTADAEKASNERACSSCDQEGRQDYNASEWQQMDHQHALVHGLAMDLGQTQHSSCSALQQQHSNDTAYTDGSHNDHNDSGLIIDQQQVIHTARADDSSASDSLNHNGLVSHQLITKTKNIANESPQDSQSGQQVGSAKEAHWNKGEADEVASDLKCEACSTNSSTSGTDSSEQLQDACMEDEYLSIDSFDDERNEDGLNEQLVAQPDSQQHQTLPDPCQQNSGTHDPSNVCEHVNVSYANEPQIRPRNALQNMSRPIPAQQSLNQSNIVHNADGGEINSVQLAQASTVARQSRDQHIDRSHQKSTPPVVAPTLKQQIGQAFPRLPFKAGLQSLQSIASSTNKGTDSGQRVRNPSNPSSQVRCMATSQRAGQLNSPDKQSSKQGTAEQDFQTSKTLVASSAGGGASVEQRTSADQVGGSGDSRPITFDNEIALSSSKTDTERILKDIKRVQDSITQGEIAEDRGDYTYPLVTFVQQSTGVVATPDINSRSMLDGDGRPWTLSRNSQVFQGNGMLQPSVGTDLLAPLARGQSGMPAAQRHVLAQFQRFTHSAEDMRYNWHLEQGQMVVGGATCKDLGNCQNCANLGGALKPSDQSCQSNLAAHLAQHAQHAQLHKFGATTVGHSPVGGGTLDIPVNELGHIFTQPGARPGSSMSSRVANNNTNEQAQHTANVLAAQVGPLYQHNEKNLLPAGSKPRRSKT